MKSHPTTLLLVQSHCKCSDSKSISVCHHDTMQTCADFKLLIRSHRARHAHYRETL